MNIAHQRDKFAEVKSWMDTLGISIIADLSSWNISGRWAGWRSLEMPDHLKTDYNHIQSLLQGYMPIHNNLKDAKSWGNAGIYTVKVGYNAIKMISEKRASGKMYGIEMDSQKLIVLLAFSSPKNSDRRELKKEGN